MKKLFSCLAGSQLYGTVTPDSDRDIMHIVLPNLADLLLHGVPKIVVEKTNNLHGQNNGPEDIDEQFIPIHCFARDFLRGQSYAIELAYAVNFYDAEQQIHDDRFELFCFELRSRFLTSEIRAMVGMANGQAKRYNFKGERLAAVRAVRELLATFPVTSKVNEHIDLFEASVLTLVDKYQDFIDLGQYDRDGKGTPAPCLKVLDKILPYNTTFANHLNVVDSMLERYGKRSKAASVDKVDWKAMMHAVRVAQEGIAILSLEGLVFPYDGEFISQLLRIRRGEVPLEEVNLLLDHQIKSLQFLEQHTGLPPVSTELIQEQDRWLLDWLQEFYRDEFQSMRGKQLFAVQQRTVTSR